MKEFTITKKISKQGRNSIIVLPKILENQLKPQDVVEVRIRMVEEAEK